MPLFFFSRWENHLGSTYTLLTLHHTTDITISLGVAVKPESQSRVPMWYMCRRMQFFGPMAKERCYIGRRMAANFVRERKLDIWCEMSMLALFIKNRLWSRLNPSKVLIKLILMRATRIAPMTMQQLVFSPRNRRGCLHHEWSSGCHRCSYPAELKSASVMSLSYKGMWYFRFAANLGSFPPQNAGLWGWELCKRNWRYKHI